MRTLFTKGNRKLGKNTLIFNLSSASNCVMRNTCSYGKDGSCYALKAERMYKQVLPYRERQKRLWNEIRNSNSTDMIKEFIRTIVSFRGISYVRFNEAGDIFDFLDIVILEYIGKELKKHGIVVYTYTHNIEALKEYKAIKGEYPKNVIINTSDTKLEELNCYAVVNSLENIPKNQICDCTRKCGIDCKRCMVYHGSTTYVQKH